MAGMEHPASEWPTSTTESKPAASTSSRTDAAHSAKPTESSEPDACRDRAGLSPEPVRKAGQKAFPAAAVEATTMDEDSRDHVQRPPGLVWNGTPVDRLALHDASPRSPQSRQISASLLSKSISLSTSGR